MNKLFYVLITLMILGNAASAVEISGSVTSLGKKLADQKVMLSKVNATQSPETGVVYDFTLLAETTTDKDGAYAFSNLNNGMYRINVTYDGITYGENTGLQGNAVMDFNLSGKLDGYVLKENRTLERIPVRLIDATGIEVMNTLTDKSGKYSFNKVDAGKSYFAEANYSDVPYTQEVNGSEMVNFTVYESTKEGDIISVNIDHIVFSRAPNGIKVDEYVEFTNTGNKVFFSKDRVWFGISTPEGITRFQTDAMECCLQREKDAAWIDPMKPIMPGEAFSVQISYVFNPESSKNTFYKDMIYNASYLTMLSEKNNGFGIESQNGKKDIVPNEGKEFEVLSFSGLPKGEKIDVRITGYVPSTTGIGGESSYLIPLAAIVLIGAVSYPLLKNRLAKKPKRRFIRPATQNTTGEPEGAPMEGIPQTVPEYVPGRDINEMSFDELLAEKNATFESIMSLETKFNAGEIQEKEYKERKKENREKSLLVIKQLKDAASNLDLQQPVPVLEKAIAHIDDIDILEDLLERETEGENRDELKEMIGQRIEDIEQNE
ncbi:SdrD B-like domain protein [uncultured archaeon]|nr:SdrD B-like domain protein [uncultured archaeon]